MAAVPAPVCSSTLRVAGPSRGELDRLGAGLDGSRPVEHEHDRGGAGALADLLGVLAGDHPFGRGWRFRQLQHRRPHSERHDHPGWKMPAWCNFRETASARQLGVSPVSKTSRVRYRRMPCEGVPRSRLLWYYFFRPVDVGPRLTHSRPARHLFC